MADGVGFEPTEALSNLGGFQDRCIKPLCHPSTVIIFIGMAFHHPGGFEPVIRLRFGQRITTLQLDSTQCPFAPLAVSVVPPHYCD